MFVTVMQGLLVRQPTSGCVQSFVGASELESVGIEQRDGNQSSG